MSEIVQLFGGTVEIQMDKRHTYLVRIHDMPVNDMDDGWSPWKKYPSVTTVLGCIDKPALKKWAAGCAVDFMEKVILPGQALDEIDLENCFETARTAFQTISKKACSIGTLVHKKIEKYLLTGEVDDIINPEAKSGFRAAIEWLSQTEHRVQKTETRGFSREYGYTGTIDYIGTIEGAPSVLDFKTSQALYDEYEIQLAAYEQLLFEQDGIRRERWLLRVDKESGKFVPKRLDAADREGALRAFTSLIPYAERHLRKQAEYWEGRRA